MSSSSSAAASSSSSAASAADSCEGVMYPRVPEAPTTAYESRTTVAVIQMLANAGANFNRVQGGVTPLDVAIGCDNYQVVEALLTHYQGQNFGNVADVRQNNIVNNPLPSIAADMPAAEGSMYKPRTMEQILAAANRPVTKPRGYFPLHLAIIANAPKSLKVILSHLTLSDINAKCDKGTALELARDCNAINSSNHCIKILEDHIKSM